MMAIPTGMKCVLYRMVINLGLKFWRCKTCFRDVPQFLKVFSKESYIKKWTVKANDESGVFGNVSEWRIGMWSCRSGLPERCCWNGRSLAGDEVGGLTL
jgi:hypothetical protein